MYKKWFAALLCGAVVLSSPCVNVSVFAADSGDEAPAEEVQESEADTENLDKEGDAEAADAVPDNPDEEGDAEAADTISPEAAKAPVHVTVHDPSVIETPEGVFYIVGSHTASAKSDDLVAWQQLNFDYGTGKDLKFYGTLTENLAEPFEWAGYHDGDASGGYAVWAPDIIWNPYYQWEDGSEGAYMLYLCTSSTWRRSCIGFMVAHEIEGEYQYVDTLVYSGFTTNGEKDGNSDRDTTWDQDYLNLKELTELGSANGGIDEISENWFNKDGSWNHTYAPNAIDPNIFFDATGEKLYMSYGSWSGGIYLLELDRATGKAIYPGTDSVDESSGNYVDRYFGVHLAGGDHQSGEGPYILWDEESGYYYMYITYGGLFAEGGYNMRLFRSKDVTGPYLDAAGRNAAENAGNGDKYGIKLIGNYAFYDQLGKRAAGHNSALIAQDGSRYLVYHQRFDVKPQLEAHEVRVHQQFLNAEGWPVPAVYEYRGEQPANYTDEEVVGPYEWICHGTSTDGKMIAASMVTLEEGGTVSGAISGTWEKSDSGKGYDYLTLTTDDAVYHGFFFRQHKENTEEEPVMTFAAIGDDNTCIWGSFSDGDHSDMAIGMAQEALKKEILETVRNYGQLPSESMGCTITWSSTEPDVIGEDGQVNVPAEDTKMVLTATITSGETSQDVEYKVTVRAQ